MNATAIKAQIIAGLSTDPHAWMRVEEFERHHHMSRTESRAAQRKGDVLRRFDQFGHVLLRLITDAERQKRDYPPRSTPRGNWTTAKPSDVIQQRVRAFARALVESES